MKIVFLGHFGSDRLYIVSGLSGIKSLEQLITKNDDTALFDRRLISRQTKVRTGRLFGRSLGKDECCGLRYRRSISPAEKLPSAIFVTEFGAAISCVVLSLSFFVIWTNASASLASDNSMWLR